jgi:hypothetical protein
MRLVRRARAPHACLPPVRPRPQRLRRRPCSADSAARVRPRTPPPPPPARPAPPPSQRRHGPRDRRRGARQRQQVLRGDAVHVSGPKDERLLHRQAARARSGRAAAPSARGSPRQVSARARGRGARAREAKAHACARPSLRAAGRRGGTLFARSRRAPRRPRRMPAAAVCGAARAPPPIAQGPNQPPPPRPPPPPGTMAAGPPFPRASRAGASWTWAVARGATATCVQRLSALAAPSRVRAAAAATRRRRPGCGRGHKRGGPSRPCSSSSACALGWRCPPPPGLLPARAPFAP